VQFAAFPNRCPGPAATAIDREDARRSLRPGISMHRCIFSEYRLQSPPASQPTQKRERSEGTPPPPSPPGPLLSAAARRCPTPADVRPPRFRSPPRPARNQTLGQVLPAAALRRIPARVRPASHRSPSPRAVFRRYPNHQMGPLCGREIQHQDALVTNRLPSPLCDNAQRLAPSETTGNTSYDTTSPD
jgi:hypothetical protein